MARWFFVVFTAILLSASPLLANHGNVPSGHANHGVAVDHDNHASSDTDCCEDCGGDCLQTCFSGASSANFADQSQIMASNPAEWSGTATGQITSVRPESTDPPPRA